MSLRNYFSFLSGQHFGIVAIEISYQATVLLAVSHVEASGYILYTEFIYGSTVPFIFSFAVFYLNILSVIWA